MDTDNKTTQKPKEGKHFIWDTINHDEDIDPILTKEEFLAVLSKVS